MHVPEGWRKGVLSDLAVLFSGFAFKSIDQKESGVRWLKIANVGFGEIKWEDESFLPVDYAHKYTHYLLKESDIVVAMTRPTLNGKLKIAKVGKNDTSLLNQRVARIDCNSNVDKDFVYHIFRSDYTAYKINESLKGTDPPNLSVKVLEDIAIIIPPLAEQEKIAEILSTWDQTIEQTERLKTNAEIHKKALMQQLLTGKKRFPEFGGEWRRFQLGNISNPKQWPTISSKQLIKSGYPVFGANGFIGYYDKYTHENEVIAVTCRGSTCGEVNLIPGKSYITGNAMCLDSINKDICDYKYLYYALKLRGFRDVITGSAQPQIVGNAIKIVDVYLPLIPEQQKIASVLNTADREIELLTKKIEHLKIEKRALMQQLLTGKRRVKVDG